MQSLCDRPYRRSLFVGPDEHCSFERRCFALIHMLSTSLPRLMCIPATAYLDIINERLTVIIPRTPANAACWVVTKPVAQPEDCCTDLTCYHAALALDRHLPLSQDRYQHPSDTHSHHVPSSAASYSCSSSDSTSPNDQTGIHQSCSSACTHHSSSQSSAQTGH